MGQTRYGKDGTCPYWYSRRWPVGPQMVKEGLLIDYPVHLARRQSDVSSPLVVTNYEMMQHFDPTEFGGLVLDESSILKNQFGKMRSEIVDFAKHIPYKLAATATPAPNDLPELLNHASLPWHHVRERGLGPVLHTGWQHALRTGG